MISATPINQVRPSIIPFADSSTSNEQSLNSLQFEYVPQIRFEVDLSITEVSFTLVTQPPLAEAQQPALRRTRSHPINQILGNPNTCI